MKQADRPVRRTRQSPEGTGAAVADIGDLVPRVDRRWFRHELTPAWLDTAALLAGLEPTDPTEPATAVWLGCGAPLTPLVAAATRPATTVIAWDPDPAKLALIERLRRESGIANLVVHEEPESPTPDDVRTAGPTSRAGLVVLDGSLDSTDDEGRRHLIEGTSRLIGPGGLIAAAYRTQIGWGEITPIVDLIRHMAARLPGNPGPGVAEALATLRELDARGARYLANRPVVAAWVRELLDEKVEDIVDRYVRRPLHPLSHARLAEEMASFGATHVGTAAPDPAGSAPIPDGAAEIIDGAGSPVLAETLSDITVRRPNRADLFSPGAVPISARVRSARLRSLAVTAFEVEGVEGLHDDPHRRHGLWKAATGRALASGVMTIGDLWPDDPPATREAKLRAALGAGLVHPVNSDADTGSTEGSAAERLTEVLTSTLVPIPHRHAIATALASAVPSAAVEDPARRRVLGVVG